MGRGACLFHWDLTKGLTPFVEIGEAGFGAGPMAERDSTPVPFRSFWSPLR